METLLRFIPVNLDSLTRVRESSRHFLNPNIAVRPVEKTIEPKALASVLVKPPSVKSGFHRLEEKAAQLGVKMAQQGFGYMDNPYSGLNQRLEGVWSSSFGKYYAALNKIEQSSEPKTQMHDVVGIRRIQAA
jgi:hypothetical protein